MKLIFISLELCNAFNVIKENADIKTRLQMQIHNDVIGKYRMLNVVWLIVAKWRHVVTYIWVILAEEIACCLTEPIHDQHQCRLIIIDALWGQLQRELLKISFNKMGLKSTHMKVEFELLEAKELLC